MVETWFVEFDLFGRHAGCHAVSPPFFVDGRDHLREGSSRGVPCRAKEWTRLHSGLDGGHVGAQVADAGFQLSSSVRLRIDVESQGKHPAVSADMQQAVVLEVVIGVRDRNREQDAVDTIRPSAAEEPTHGLANRQQCLYRSHRLGLRPIGTTGQRDN